MNAKSKIFVIIFTNISQYSLKSNKKYLFISHKYKKKNCIHTRIHIHYLFIYSNIGYIHRTH